jgi:hypothetical protein
VIYFFGNFFFFFEGLLRKSISIPKITLTRFKKCPPSVNPFYKKFSPFKITYSFIISRKKNLRTNGKKNRFQVTMLNNIFIGSDPSDIHLLSRFIFITIIRYGFTIINPYNQLLSKFPKNLTAISFPQTHLSAVVLPPMSFSAVDIALQGEINKLKQENANMKQVIALLIELLPADKRSHANELLTSTPTPSVPSTPIPSSIKSFQSTPITSAPLTSTPSAASNVSNGAIQVLPQGPSKTLSGGPPPPPYIPSAPSNTSAPIPSTQYSPYPSSAMSRTPSNLSPGQPPPPLQPGQLSRPASSLQRSTSSLSDSPSLTPHSHINPSQGFVIYGTTYPQAALNDIKLLVQGKSPSFESISLSKLVLYLKAFKDREAVQREKSFYAKILHIVRHLDLDGASSGLFSNLIVPFSYFPLDITADPERTDLAPYDTQCKGGKLFSPVEWFRFLVCVQYNLPYSDTHDVLHKLLFYFGLPILTPIDFSSSLSYTKYLTTHSGFYKSTKNNTAPGSYTMLYISNTSDCDITFWLNLISRSPILLNVITRQASTDQESGLMIYQDSYITMPYWRCLLELTETIAYLALCFNTINMNLNHRSTEHMFSQFFALTNTTWKQPMTFSELYEFCWVISFFLNQFCTSAPAHYVSGPSTCIHWLIKTFGSNQNASDMCYNLTSLLVCSEFYYISYNSLQLTQPIINLVNPHFREFKNLAEKVVAKKALSKTDLMLINNIQGKLSQQLRDIFNGSSTVLVNNYTQNTQGVTLWLKDLVNLVKNA